MVTDTKPLVNIKREEEAVANIRLDDYNSELHINFQEDYLVASNMEGSGFEYMWGGVRATHGVSQGKVCSLSYEYTITQLMSLLKTSGKFFFSDTKNKQVLKVFGVLLKCKNK